MFEELDRIALQGSFNGNHLKKDYKNDNIKAKVEREANKGSLTKKGEDKGYKVLILED
jgi:hypothetical protein